MYSEADLLPISALQHLVFCERQCALIHIEKIWIENAFTADGRRMHEKAHTEFTESRRGRRKENGMLIRSNYLGVFGMTDTVEFDENKVPYPIEYKRGRPKSKNMDEIQLCAQAMCLEEMTGKPVLEGALFYGKTRRRKNVVFDEKLRYQTKEAALRLHELIKTGRTPPPVYTKQCHRCSLADFCQPKLFSARKKVDVYTVRMLNKPLGED